MKPVHSFLPFLCLILNALALSGHDQLENVSIDAPAATISTQTANSFASVESSNIGPDENEDEGNSPQTIPSNQTSEAGFVHPGVFVSKPQLDFIKEQVNAKNEPWASGYDTMMSSEFGKLSRDPSARSSVDCGSRSQNPSNGCWEERGDAIAAYSMALAYYITSDNKYAEKSVSIMNAWARKIKKHTASNAPLQTGWSAVNWARAGELMKHTYDGWESNDLKQFQDMLRTVYLPFVIDGRDNTGNWDLVMAEAAMGISIFLDDTESYEKSLSRFERRVPAFIYLKKDGKNPKAAKGSPQDGGKGLSGFWHGLKSFEEDGVAQETCRDFVHTGYALSSISHIMESALIQGKDYYTTEIGDRLHAALEFHSKFQNGASQPGWLCSGKSLTLNMEAMTEVGYNAFHNRLGRSLPHTKKYTDKKRPAGSNKLFIAWETLTHAQNTAGFDAAKIEGVEARQEGRWNKRVKKISRRHLNRHHARHGAGSVWLSH